jgi:hypothetical protein
LILLLRVALLFVSLHLFPVIFLCHVRFLRSQLIFLLWASGTRSVLVLFEHFSSQPYSVEYKIGRAEWA